MALLSKLRNRIAPHAERERGAVLVLTALVMLLLLFIAAFATDLGAWYRQGQEQQRAADVGALNGVQAYDRGVKAYFEGLEAASGGTRDVNRWSHLTTDEMLLAEEEGLREAANTIIALMETSGLSFSDVGSGSLAADPTDVNGTSVWTVTADDGTEIRITRSFVVTGTDSGGSPVYSRSIDVVVVASGEQYFSNIIRDAPEIERAASSVLSNCGAICEDRIEINPPFVGFSVSSSGDGYAPHPFDKDPAVPGFEEIWTMNHHSNGAGGVHFLCFDAEARTFCSGGNDKVGINYVTPNRPVEYVSPAGKMYFSAQEPGDTNGGIGCFDFATRAYCSTPFVELWPTGTLQAGGGYSGGAGYLGINGPWEHNGNLFIIDQAGYMGCAVAATMSPCSGSWPKPTAAAARTEMPPAIGVGEKWIQHGEQAGGKVYMVLDTPTGAVFQCVNLDMSVSNCWSGTRFHTEFVHGSNHETFFRYDQNRNRTGICTANIETGDSQCYSLTGSDQGALGGMKVWLQDAIGQHGSWGGDSFSWNRRRVFFAGGNSSRIACWSWEGGGDGAPCPELSVVHTDPSDPNYTGAGTARTYAFGQVTDNCIIAGGHNNQFYSFNPQGMAACVDAKLVTEITPCECEDGANKWGKVELPVQLLGLVDEVYATVSATDPRIDAGWTPYSTELTAVPLHDLNGSLDLSSIDNSVPKLFLELSVNAKIDPGTGLPAWTTPIEADLQITVQPTLAS